MRYIGGRLTDSADVLSTVQNSMSAGQDPSQALSRLMDWAEARGVSDLIECPRTCSLA
jgi:hypothetical protein